MPDHEQNHQPNEADAAITKALRIAELQAELASLTGEPISRHLAEDADDESDRMIEDLEAIESGLEMPLYDILQQRRNFTPVPLARLKHPIDVGENLWLLLYALASIRVFIYDTNHLSDDELYAVLLHKALTDSTTILPEGSGWNCRISICEITDSHDPHQSCYLRFYADEETRQWIAAEYPDNPMPAKEEPPFERDFYLPTI
jgi:hypothetical protein